MSDSFSTMMKTRKTSGGEDSVMSMMSTDEFPEKRFNDLSSISLGDTDHASPVHSEDTEKDSDSSKQLKRRKSSKKDLNTSTTTTKTTTNDSYLSNQYQNWYNLTKNLTG